MKYLILCLFISTSLWAKSDLEKSIFVSGACKQDVLPDRVSVLLTIEELNKKQKVSAQRASEKYNKILKKIKELKLKNAEYATTEYRVFPHRPLENRKQVFKGYKTRISLKVSTSDMDKTGTLLSLGNELGQDFVSGPDSFVSDELFDKTYRDCLKVAMKDAKAKALIIAKAAKRKLGKVLAVSEGHSSGAPTPSPPYYKAAAMEVMGAARSAPAKIEFGKDKIHVTLAVHYELN